MSSEQGEAYLGKIGSGRTAYIIASVSGFVLVLAVAAYFYSGIFHGITPDKTGESSALKVAVLTDADFGDKGWGESSLLAAQAIENKYNLTVATKDNVPIADIEMTLDRYANDGYELIIAHGVQWGEPAIEVAKKYPDVRIVVFTGLVQSQNVASIFPEQQEGSFLLGALAAMMSKTGTIGFVGGEEYPNVINILEGYRQGARSINDNVTVISTYLNDWDNPPKGEEAATSIIRQGADVVFHVADSSGQGVIDSAKENRIYALGAVQDQNHLAPDTVLTSFVLDVDKAYDSAVKMVMYSNFTGTVFRPGIQSERGSPGDGIVYLAPYHSLESRIPDGVKERIMDLRQEILEGKLKVPERLG